MTRCKRYLSAFLALIMCIGILPITSIAVDSNDGLLNFTKTLAYSDSVFTDVHEDDWFSDNVKAVYEYELMNGKGNSCFDPENSVTIAETITIAARLNAQYYIGTDVFVNSEPWYQTYVDYAENCGIIDDATDDFNAPATRGIFADIIANALPDSAFEEINIVAYSGIPDVSLTDSFGRSVYKLYRAGIMIGNDESGTFAPESNIKRCEVAAIVTRMVEPSLRKTVQLGREYAVSFDLGYEGKKLDVQKVVEGYTAEEPDTPVRKNYIFDGWYTAQNGGYKFEFETEILSDMTLYAHWKNDPAYLSWVMSGIANGDKDTPDAPDKPDDPKEEYDYSKLPYRPGKTWEELTEVNGGKEPYIELNDNDQVGLYIGRISDNKVTDVYDVIAELNNVRELLNINDARFEFIPSYEDGKIDDKSYRVQQVHNGVQVWCAQIVVIVDDDGYINGFISDYVDYVRYSGVETDPAVSAEQAVYVAYEDALDKFENVNDNIKATLVVMPETADLIWYMAVLTGDGAYKYYIDAHNREIRGCMESMPLTESLIYDENKTQDVTESFEYYDGTDSFVDIISVDEKNIITYYMCSRSVNPLGIRIHNMNGVNESATKKTDYPGDIYSSTNNVWNDARAAFCGVYDFNRVAQKYLDMGFVCEYPIEVNININYENACYSGANNKRTAIEYIFGYTTYKDGYKNRIRKQLDTIGHEYTHMVQDKYISAIIDDYWTADGSLGDGYVYTQQDNGNLIISEQDSSNIDWVEAQAISEGTADVMGMLIEATYEKIDIRNSKSDDGDKYFWMMGESKDGTYAARDHSYPSKDKNANQSVQMMKDYYKANKNLKYGKGPGHNDCYIVVCILRYLIDHTKLTSDQLMELWYKTITKLNAKSNFNHLRTVLIASAEEIKLGDYISNTIKDACDSVGITENGKRGAYEIWFYKGLEKAWKSNIIRWENVINSATDIITRREYLALLANMCEKVGVNVDSDVVAWAKKLRVIGNLWTDDYLDKSIPKWEVTLLMYHVFNIYHDYFQKYGWKEVFGYEFVSGTRKDYWQLFKYQFSEELVFNKDTSMSGIDIYELIQYYKNCAEYDDNEKTILSEERTLKSFQLQNMKSKYVPKTYITGECDKDTIEAYYCTGFYQLWRNGMFEGYSSSGKLRLGTTDSISLGEACALITQVIPD